MCIIGCGAASCATSTRWDPTTPSGTSSSITATASDNPFRVGRPLVIPHAGGDGLYPENTLYAYEHSMAMGGDVIDADVLITADGVPIAFHDASLDRTTNGTGNVHDKTYAELAALDAGWAFERDGDHLFRGLGITIPTIESILMQYPNTLVTLDLKDQRTTAVEPVCSLIVRLDRTDDVYVGVDIDEQVELFRTLCPTLRTSGTSAERAATRAARESNDPNFVTNQLVSQPAFIADDGTRRITTVFLDFAHRHDVAVLTWVVDDPDDLRDLIEMGVDGIYTRRPDLMIDLLRDAGLL